MQLCVCVLCALSFSRTTYQSYYSKAFVPHRIVGWLWPMHGIDANNGNSVTHTYTSYMLKCMIQSGKRPRINTAMDFGDLFCVRCAHAVEQSHSCIILLGHSTWLYSVLQNLAADSIDNDNFHVIIH